MVLTGTLLGGYADEVFNILFRMHPSRMVQEGFEYGKVGVRMFTEAYGLLEKITVIEPADNACSEARVTKRVRRRPGASPLLFGRFLMSVGAFISLEDIFGGVAALLGGGRQCGDGPSLEGSLQEA